MYRLLQYKNEFVERKFRNWYGWAYHAIYNELEKWKIAKYTILKVCKHHAVFGQIIQVDIY